MSGYSFHVGLLTVELFLPMCASLKDKRRITKSIKDRIRARHNVSAAEIGDLDKWQKSVLGMSIIGGDKKYLEGNLTKILSFIDTVGDVQIVSSQIEFI